MKIQTETDTVEIKAISRFLPDQSDPSADRYVFAYHITISNRSEQTVKLLTRHWIITDAEDKVQEVRGEGVIGQQPVLRPGESFEYTSGCSIATPVGTMKGSYFMEADDGRQFDAPVAEFTLAMPRTLH
ncbi:Co2+/Mg2+ efflux protein ApaG [Zoogloea sp.]|uniref:Co2+/Mg2+ efflux protein ApaG n=1 Tax=Zoogloea sp. TaxID=49181 RepID=UPI0026325D1D|nr:Co2+/Mg2+ efflux protein ApaG [Zoogloea sp.]MCK6387099.1 Co2+/Mg2+ efflux protein ApaG [Zoogloea sp.]MDD3328943.1 Co2+/Mg2+ efflux protein ApaG [Zoogloea sp.]